MKLFYYQDPKGNFGDDLNPWIWNAMAPEIFDDDDSTVLMGIGTLINTKAPVQPRKIVFGSGVGYHKLPPIDDKWTFHCVRGPLSAQRLGLDRSLAITDPALLLRQIVTSPAQPRGHISYMPHHASLRYADWRSLCARAGLQYLDPADDVVQTVARIRASGLVIAEAMHAAIVADAFRVPWIPVSCYDHILEFKWNDWCESLQMQYQPLQLPRIWDREHMMAGMGVAKRMKGQVRQGLQRLGLWHGQLPPAPNRTQVEDDVVRALARVAEHAQPCLSRDDDQRIAMERLLGSLDALKRNFHIQGQYA